MPDLLLSIVTGTYNRLESLQRMINSVRQQLPRHLTYEFVVVDGGSGDDTPRWCLKQKDVRFIQQGALLGAISAFCEGARAAQGEYVLLANDDVIFHEGSLIRAVAYLEEHRACGAVAFADDRAAQMTGGPKTHQVLGMPAIDRDGELIHVPYAQVGLFRRWLGDRTGWWGVDDDIMGRARTYGGDNYLSSRIWELGYTVDEVPGCAVDDLIPRDTLRAVNSQSGQTDSAQYYARFPRGAQIPDGPRVGNPQRERLRVLLADIHEARLPARKAQEAGLAEALAEVGLVWHIDYQNEGIDLPLAVRLWQPHLVLLQLHGTEHVTAADLRAARAEKPDVVIVNWNGDAHEDGLIGPAMLEVLREVDLQTGVNAAVFPVYEAEGIPCAYWQIGYKDPAERITVPAPAHDVLFLGNCYNEPRRALVEILRAGDWSTGIYGNCPESNGFTHYDFDKSRALYEACQIAVSDTFDPEHTRAFVSNRLFQAMAAGAFVLQQASEGLTEHTGLVDGEHLVFWKDLEDLQNKIPYWLDGRRTSRRDRIAEAGQAYVRANFSYPAQVRKLWGLLDRIEGAQEVVYVPA